MIRVFAASVVGVMALGLYVFASPAQAQGFVAVDPAVARDAQRVEDLQTIKKAIDDYAAYHWFYPRYHIQSPAMSDEYWRRTLPSRDFRKRLKQFINQLPIDPLNDAAQNFRYVYGYVPHGDESAPDCAGTTVLFATRVETDAAHYQECDFGGADKRILYIITSKKKPAARDLFAGALAPFVKLLSVHF